MLLHDRQELDNDLGRRTDKDLALAGLLGIVHGIEGVVKDGSADHLGGIGIESRFSNRFRGNEVSVKSAPQCRPRAMRGRKSQPPVVPSKECPFIR